MSDFRTEHDSMGDVQVPIDALWRAQTQRAIENFPVSGLTVEPSLLRALAAIKGAAARANASLGVLDPDKAQAISDAAALVESGEHAVNVVLAFTAEPDEGNALLVAAVVPQE